MPRFVNISTSDHSSSGEELQVTPAPLPQQRPVETAEINNIHTEEFEEIIDCTMYSTNVINYDEDEVYCLSRIIDGKIRKFKKDTRMWLHKSSDKAKLRRGIENLQQTEMNRYRYRIPVNYSVYAQQRTVSDTVVDQENGKFAGKNGNCGFETHSHSEENITKPVNIVGPIVEFYDDRATGNSNFKTTHNPIAAVEEELSYMGDSDADLTYSEEDSPVKTRSFVDDWRQMDVNQISSNSSSSLVTIDNDNDRSPSVHSLISADSFRGDESFEEIDRYNESGNSIRPCLAGLEPLSPGDVPRKIAPAIEMERESYRESVLDCGVNTIWAGAKADEGGMYCDELHRKNRSRAGSRVHVPETSRRPASRRSKQGTSMARPRDCTAVTSSYCLRSKQGGGPSSMEETTRAIPKSAEPSGSELPCKRIRFNDQIEEEPGPIKQKPADRTPAACAPPELEVEGTSDEVPSCSKDGGKDGGQDGGLRTRVPSLFVIAGYVLYGMYNGSFGG